MPKAKALEVPCPNCGAAPGEPCKVPSVGITRQPHNARVKAQRRAAVILEDRKWTAHEKECESAALAYLREQKKGARK